MNNPAFVVTGAGVVVIDPGSSVQVGEMVLTHVRKVTGQPVVAVFDTHVHGDHWLGNQAIAEAFPDARIYAHPRMRERVEQGAGEQWLEVMMNMTEGATAGTRVVNANTPVDEGTEIRIGDVTFRILHDGKAHTDNDIMILLPERSVIFLGDQASLRSRERFWDIRVPKIDSIFDNSLVPRPSWSPGVPPQHRKLVAATHRSPI